jgi:anthranilate/para-aminobenzoate synthase component I
MYSPSLEEFQRLAAQGNLIPVTRRLLADFETPLSAYSKIRGQGESFLFESIEGGEHLGRYSFVGCNPRAIIWWRSSPFRASRTRIVTNACATASKWLSWC